MGRKTIVTTRYALCVSLTSAVVACAQLAGLDGYDVTDDAGSTNANGDGGNGALDGTGGTSSGTMDGVAPNNDGANPSDTSLQNDVTPSPECASWKASAFDACAIPAPGAFAVPVPLTTITYDTDIPGFVEDGMTDPPSTTLPQNGTPVVVISVDTFMLSAATTMRVIGAKPLIIASWSTITLAGTIDASSAAAVARAGAGANPSACSAQPAATDGADEVDLGMGSGGGGGGAFGGTGGKGGPGDIGQNAGGNGGQLVPAAPTIVRGGCSGAASGKAGPDPQIQPPSNANTKSAGGFAGGAVQLSARGAMTLSATARVLANGAGGGGAPLHAATGGGGGGSGGFIGFDAPAIALSAGARITANGGGGGSSDAVAVSGRPGNDGRDDATRANGGAGGACSNPGGAGGAGTNMNGDDSSQTTLNCGGGGGGGSVGYIIVHSASFSTPANIFSPLPIIK